MSKGYRQYAAQCLALAQAAEDARVRAHLVQLAERWREMAQQAETENFAAQDEPVSRQNSYTGQFRKEQKT